MSVKKRTVFGRNRINWLAPTAADIESGLSDEQKYAVRSLCWREDLSKPVEKWRDALLIWQGVGQPAGLTKMGQKVREILLAAQGIEAGTDETLQAAQPEGQEPGGEAMRPNNSQDR